MKGVESPSKSLRFYLKTSRKPLKQESDTRSELSSKSFAGGVENEFEGGKGIPEESLSEVFGR